MNEGLIPRRYAKAIHEYALEKGKARELYGLMRNIVSAFLAEASMQQVMSNPFVADDDKVKLLVTASQGKADDAVLADVLKLLAGNGRLAMARDIALAYLEIYRKANNIYLVDVTTAAPMEDADLTRLKTLVERHLNGGTMEFTCKVDASLIGGFVVNIDSERLDASVSNELKQLRLKLLSK